MEQRTKIDGFILTYITKISSAIVICMSFITRHHDYKLSRGNKTFHKKTRAATKGVLKNLQNSQENICARVSCLTVNFAKFLRIPFLQKHLQTTASKIPRIYLMQICTNRLTSYKRFFKGSPGEGIERRASYVNSKQTKILISIVLYL